MAILPYRWEVTTPAASKDLTVLATVKTELKITDSAQDTYIGVLIQQASGKAVELANREFCEETLTDYFRDASCSDTLQLTRFPIESVTSVTEDGTVLAGTDYEIDAASGWLIRLDSDSVPMAWGSGKIVVVYVAGWDTLTDIPHALERIVINEIKRNYFGRERDPSLKAESVDGVGRFDYGLTFSPAGKDPMLAELEAARFVIPVVG